MSEERCVGVSGERTQVNPDRPYAVYADPYVLRHADKLKGSEKLEFEPIVELYRRACALSRGSDDKRSEHWRKRALQMERKLRRLFFGEQYE